MGHVVRLGKQQAHTKFHSKKMNSRDHLGDTDTGERIILKRLLKK